MTPERRGPRPGPGSLLVSMWMLLFALAISAKTVVAADPAPGHSLHGEAFNEGPRQQAYLMSGMPPIDFPISTTNPQAVPFFNQGVGQLHGFWYFEAERSFRQVHELDTNCPMAFWGMAMANVNNENRARDFIRKAMELEAAGTPRERLYIRALSDFYIEKKGRPKREEKERCRDLVRAYEDIVRQFPADHEAKGFLVYQIWANQSADLSISSHLSVDTLARQVLEAHPSHPVHHYRIHLWDNEHPLQALDSAARCGQGSPGIAHLWHMPGHTYAKLSRHDDAAWQQEASARVDHAHMMRDRVLPDQIFNYAHNNGWLIESWSHLGRAREAIELAKNMIELPRLAHTNAALARSPFAYPYDFGGSSWKVGRNKLVEVLTKFELWDELLTFKDSPYLADGSPPAERVQLAAALALAWFAKGEPGRATNQLATLEEALVSLRTERHGAMDLADQKARQDRKSRTEISQVMSEATGSFHGRIDEVESLAAEIRAYAALANGDVTRVLSELELATQIPQERLAMVYWTAGSRTKALELAAEAAGKATNQVQQTASYADLLWRAGQTHEAQRAFQKLRESRAWPDLDLPVIQRLQPIAQSLGLPPDWRVRQPARDDVGARPDLDSLGPLHWTPTPAPGWTLTEAGGRSRSLNEFRGRPVVVMFYLGRRCSHCLEQLNGFAAASGDFHAAGIELLAISTDSIDTLRMMRVKDSGEAFPFPLLADPDLAAFKAWRVHDDFEDVPLHGTFLVDHRGMIRWQDIGHQPFTETGFLLNEARRLLRFEPRWNMAGVPSANPR